MSKLVYLKDNLEGISKGVKLLSDSVGSTLGPSGKTVIIHRIGEDPFITKDGVTVAKEVDSDDDIERLGIMLARKASTKMDEEEGDGTTSTTVILNGLFEEFNAAKFEMKNFDMYAFHNRMHALVDTFCDELEKSSRVPTINDLRNIALTSSNNDVVIAELFLQAFNNVGKEGYINFVDSTNGKSYLDIINGFVLEMGYADRKYANNPFTNFFEAKEASVLLYDAEFTDRKQMINFLHNEKKTGLPILIIAKNYSTDVVEVVDFNNSNALNPRVCLVKNIYRNDEYDGLMSDIEHYTEAERTKEYSDFDTVLGYVNDLVVKQGYMIFGEASESVKQPLEDYLELLALSAKEESSAFLKEQILKRVSRIKNGVTTLYIGGDSEIEIKERRHRVEDAFKACKSAIKNKVVVGGGNTLMAITKLLVLNSPTEMIFSRAILKPYLLILKNSMHLEAEINKISFEINFKICYNARERKYEHTEETSVLDPLNVVVNSIKNAVSIFLTVISTECVIIEKEKIDEY